MSIDSGAKALNPPRTMMNPSGGLNSAWGAVEEGAVWDKADPVGRRG
jgi:hypothetical protein